MADGTEQDNDMYFMGYGQDSMFPNNQMQSDDIDMDFAQTQFDNTSHPHDSDILSGAAHFDEQISNAYLDSTDISQISFASVTDPPFLGQEHARLAPDLSHRHNPNEQDHGYYAISQAQDGYSRSMPAIHVGGLREDDFDALQAWPSHQTDYTDPTELDYQESASTLPSFDNTAQPSNDVLPQQTLGAQQTGEHQCKYKGCGKRFVMKGDMKKHARKHILKDKRPHACPICSKRFLHPKEVRRHELIHGDATFKCEDCGRSFKRDDHLKRHKDGNACPAGRTKGSASRARSESNVPILRQIRMQESDTNMMMPPAKLPATSRSRPTISASDPHTPQPAMVDNFAESYFMGNPPKPHASLHQFPDTPMSMQPHAQQMGLFEGSFDFLTPSRSTGAALGQGQHFQSFHEPHSTARFGSTLDPGFWLSPGGTPTDNRKRKQSQQRQY